MRSRGSMLLACALFGAALGFTVSNIGFGDYAELHRMFTFQDLRMFFAFAGGVGFAAVVLGVTLRRRPPRTPVHAGIVPGAVLFGAGWAISGGCPAIPIVQVASGYLPALVTIAGITVGMRACQWFTTRYFPVDRGSCGM
ncbi:MAG TPA: DUF6691 family protein [Kineosporiaceae bacterium]